MVHLTGNEYLCEDCETVVILTEMDFVLDNWGGSWKPCYTECRCKEIWGDAA